MKWPKYIVMPIALLIYFVAMAIYGISRNEWHLPSDFFLICAVEIIILVGLFFLLRYQHKKRKG